MQKLKNILGVLLLLALINGCSTNPVSGVPELALSKNWERTIGPKYHQEVLKQYQVYDHPVLQAYVDDIGQRLAKKSHRSELPFTFTLLDSPQVNAFALPGGYVYITRGIMAYMTKEAHLAGVLGHEIGHVTARHGAQRAAQQQVSTVANTIISAAGVFETDVSTLFQFLGGALISGYGRKQELQSDRLGAEYIAKNAYNVDDMLGVIEILKNQEVFAAQKATAQGRAQQGYHGLFASHPQNDQRLQEVIKAANKYRGLTQVKKDDGTFLRLTNHMAFGDSEKQGIVRENRFYHKELDFFVQFPESWQIVNSPAQIMAVSKDSNQILQLRMESVSQGVSAKDFLRKKFTNLYDTSTIADKMNSYAGIAEITHPKTQQKTTVEVGAVILEGQAFVVVGAGKTNLPHPQLSSTVASIRRLTSLEKPLAKEHKIKLVIAKKGDTYAKLAKQSTLGRYAQEQLRLINNQYPEGEPTVGQQIKIIK